MSIIKDICYNPDNGRLILSDSENNHYLCDLFGRKYPEFLPDITGFVNGKKRKKLAPLSFSSQITIPTYQHFTEYYPTIRRFEGYSKFPRPLVPPFANIPNYDLKDNCKKELIKQLQKYFSNNEAKVFIGKENENKGLSYLTCDLNQCDVAKEDSVKLLKIIDETFKSYRQIYKYQLNTLKTNPVLVALTQFKEVLSRNENMKIINGRLLKIPGNEIIEKYNSIHERMRKIGLKHMKIVKKEYSKTYRNEVPDINEITNSSDITLGKRIYGKFGIYSYEEEQRKKEEEEKRLEEEEKRKEEEEKLKAEMEQKRLEEEAKKKEEDEKNKNVNVEENKIDENNIKELNDNLAVNEEEKKEEEKKEEEKKVEKKEENLDEKIKKGDISFISLMSENEKKFKKEHIIEPIKSLFLFNKRNKRENALLNGFIDKPYSEPPYFRKGIPTKMKTNGELMDEDLELLRKTNPIAFDIQNRKMDEDFRQLKRKVMLNRITIRNMERQHKINEREKEKEREWEKQKLKTDGNFNVDDGRKKLSLLGS